MKKTIGLLAALCTFAVSIAAQAAVVTYDFTADVTLKSGDNAAPFVAAGFLAAGETAATITGSFTFDTSDVDGGVIHTSNVDITSAGDQLGGGDTLIIDSEGFQFASFTFIYEVVVLADSDGSSFSDETALSSLELSGLDSAEYRISTFKFGDGLNTLSGQITQLSRQGASTGGGATAVPELSAGSAASSIGLLAGGALVLSSRRRHSDAA